MVLTTPILAKINTFDPHLDNNIHFTYTGGQIQKKRLIIKDASTLEIVYDDIQESMKLSYLISAYTLTHGQYIAQIQVFDFDGNSSEFSELVLFYCYSIPVLSFVNLPNVLNKANVTLEVSYFQAQGDNLSELVYYLYDRNKILLSQSPVMYSALEYIFYGLQDKDTYYVRCVGKTISGMTADTGYSEIVVKYVIQPNNMIFQLINHFCEGYISIDCNIIAIGYEVVGNKEYIIDNGEAIIKNGTTVTYNSGFDFSDDFSIFVKARKLPLNREFLTIVSKYGNISLSIENIADKYYCTLVTPSALETYYRYTVLPNVNVSDGSNIIIDNSNNALGEATVEYQDDYIAVFELKRKNNLYSLKVYYEDNGVVVVNEN